MVIDWISLTYYVVGFFAVMGFFRGWWKEAVTTAFLAVLLLLLNQPDVASQLIAAWNSLVEFVWFLIPTNVTTISEGGGEAIVAVSTTTQPAPLLADVNDPNTWLYMLVTALGLSALFTRRSFSNEPDGVFGHLLGVVAGAFNGFLVMGLAREYLDGRALPGNAAAATTDSGLTLASNSDFGQATNEVMIQATSLPSYTILDSIIPWVVIIIGALLFFATVKTRYGFNGDKLDYRLPPFYKAPKPGKKPKTVDDVIEKMYK